MRKIHIGDVLVHEGEPHDSNPYHGYSLIGAPRKHALRLFKHGLDLDATYTFWHAPANGGASQLTDPSKVDWESSGVD